jgi:glycosyltransferase involved in cell wall biosynthesis
METARLHLCHTIIIGMPVSIVVLKTQESFVMNNSFTIIVPLYNSALFLERCIKSLQNQNYNNFEVVLVDDGSQDETFALCQGYEKKDSRFNAYTKNNEGQGVARNFGLAKAKNDFILYVDSDDFIESDALKNINEAINSTPDCDFVNFLIDFVDENNRPRHQSARYSLPTMSGDDIFISAMLDRDILSSPCNKAYRRCFLLNNKIEFPSLRKNEDIIYSRIIGYYSKKTTFINKTLYHALIRSGSTSRNITSDNLKDSLLTIDKLKFFMQEKDIFDQYEIVFNAFVVRHLTYLLIIISFCSDDYNGFKRKVDLTTDIGLKNYLKNKKVISLLSIKQKIMALLCRVPLVLFSMAKLSTKLGLYNPGR